MKQLATILALVTMVIFTGCNTVKGLGEDVSKAGDKVTDTAERTQDKL